MKVDFIFTASIDLVEAGVGFEVGERERVREREHQIERERETFLLQKY